MNNNFYNKLDPFSFNEDEKKEFFEKKINSLTLYHYKNSKDYKKILDLLGYRFKRRKLDEVPFLPAKLFKEFELRSISKKKYSKLLSHQALQEVLHQKFI